MRSDPSEALSRIQLWAPDVRPVHGGDQPRRGLRVACILSDRLFDGLLEEVELLLLTEANWEETLRFGRVDLLLVESTWFTCTGDWYMAQSVAGDGRERLDRLVAVARSLGIPTAFWITLDSEHLGLYRAFAGQFDQVFCADVRAVDALKREGTAALPLEPAIQPRRYNPIRWLEDSSEVEPGLLYDGWKDLYRFGEVRAVLDRLDPSRLSVIDTSCMMKRVQVDRIPEPGLRPAIKGWLHRHLLPEVYKRADAYLTFSQTASTATQTAWRLLEATACRLPALHLGKLEESDPRSRFTRVFSEAAAFIEAAADLLDDPLGRELSVHRIWRDVHANHCFSDRIGTICDTLGIGYESHAHPKVSIVTGTMRPHLLQKCVTQFLDQSWPNKELIVVFNGSAQEIEGIRQDYGSRGNIKFVSVPTDHNAASLLNLGAMRASGEYFFRVDDDDHYGANYILDCMLYLRACDADVFGKPAAFYHFEGEEGLYLRRSLMPKIVRFAAADLHKDHRTMISGCSFACKMDLLKSVRYPDAINLAADTELVERLNEDCADKVCLSLDSLNLVVERSADVEKHTWQQGAEALKDGSRKIDFEINDLML